MYDKKTISRFWEKVEKREPDECWLWTGATHPSGYGKLRVGYRRTGDRTTDGAHRISYRISHGDIPHGLYVLHTCDNRLCVNPAHLFAGTQRDNLRDMDAKGRRVNADTRGTKNGRAKLTEQDVLDIRDLYAEGNLGYKAIAKKYGVTWASIGRIIQRKAWSHI